MYWSIFNMLHLTKGKSVIDTEREYISALFGMVLFGLIIQPIIGEPKTS